MKAKTKKAFEMTERFTADSGTIEEPGSSTTYSRAEVEGWLRGMEIVRRYQDDDACRRAVAETIVLNRSKRREQREIGLLLLGVFLLGFYCLFLSAHEACASEIIRGFRLCRRGSDSWIRTGEQACEPIDRNAPLQRDVGLRLTF